MTPKEIKAELKARGYSNKMLAEILGKSVSAVGQVINKTSYSREIAEAVCKAIDKELLDVFHDVKPYHQSKSQLREQKKRELAQVLSA
jgi:predicted transcriptional regulator